MSKLIFSLVLATFALFSLTAPSPAAVANGPGAGLTVTESWTTPGGGSASADIRYEGLGEDDANGNPNTSGTRWRQTGEEWHEDGTWGTDGDDIEIFSDDGELAQVNHDMNAGDKKSGRMTDETGSGLTGGKWTNT